MRRRLTKNKKDWWACRAMRKHTGQLQPWSAQRHSPWLKHVRGEIWQLKPPAKGLPEPKPNQILLCPGELLPRSSYSALLCWAVGERLRKGPALPACPRIARTSPYWLLAHAFLLPLIQRSLLTALKRISDLSLDNRRDLGWSNMALLPLLPIRGRGRDALKCEASFVSHWME